MCGNNKEKPTCLAEVLELILSLQQKGDNSDCLGGCAKPYLGDSNIFCLNTRPVTLYCCCADERWTFPATVNGSTVNSDVFRIENLNNNCATFRCLVRNCNNVNDEEEYIATEDFFTIDLSCVALLKCLNDTNVYGI